MMKKYGSHGALIAGVFLLAFSFAPTIYAQDNEGTTPPLVFGAPDSSEIVSAIPEKRVTCDYDGVSLEEVLEDLEEQTGLEFMIDEAALNANGIDADIPLTFEVEDFPLDSALRHMLREYDLAWTAWENAIVITTPQTNCHHALHTHVYVVSDLLGPIPARSADAAAAEGDANEVDFGVWGQSILSQDGPEDDYDSLIELITSTVFPLTWDEVGGIGSIAFFEPSKSLIISQSLEVHAQIEELLSLLRQARATASQLQEPLDDTAIVQRTYNVPYEVTHFDVETDNEGNRVAGSPEEQMERLSEAILDTIAPESWESEGGEGTLHRVGGVLLIQQTPAVHAKIEALIDSLSPPLSQLGGGRGYGGGGLGGGAEF